MHRDIADVVIVGGGIIGCAVALELASKQRHQSILLLEKSPYLGDGMSTRNSHVIHAGIHYPPGSMKARFCVEGNRRTYEFCEKYNIACLSTGKLVLASAEEEIPKLEELQRNGTECGSISLALLSSTEARKLEPNVHAAAALHSPSTGVFDAAQWFRVVEGLLADRGVMVLKETKVIDVSPADGHFTVVTDRRGEVGARYLVNAAGLFSDEIANMAGNRYRIQPCRGDYFTVVEAKSHLVRGAIYPLPEAHGLGIHLTKLTDGTILIGPDSRYVADKNDYSTLPVFDDSGNLRFDSEHFRKFFESARKILPMLSPEDIRLAHCGIRPKLRPPDDATFQDFFVERDRRHPRMIHCMGIESPGLTAALPIARHVATLVREMDS
jgi:glycerol-3-phosphate dehydrogenase